MISTLKTEAQFALVKWLNLFSLGLMKGVEEIEVRPFSGREEYELMLDYFYKADDSFLRGTARNFAKETSGSTLFWPTMRDQTAKETVFTWIGYFEDGVLDTRVSIRL